MPTDPSRRGRSLASAADDIIAAFRFALEARGIDPPATLQADGELHRCSAAAKHGKGDAAYALHLDEYPASGFINWCDGRSWEPWRFNAGRTLRPDEQRALQQRFEAAARQRLAASAQRHQQAAKRAASIWSRSRSASDGHPYLVAKKVRAHGIRVCKGALVVPVFDPSGSISSLQFTGASGAKRFLKGARVEGGSFVLGGMTDPVCIAEGYATAASIHESTGYGVVVAFHAGNLMSVASDVRRRYPAATLIVCADDDRGTEGNPGLAAGAAARAVRGLLASPGGLQDGLNGSRTSTTSIVRRAARRFVH